MKRPATVAVTDVAEMDEVEEAVPNGERLVAEAVTLGAQDDDDELAKLVARYWRLVPDEELIGCTPQAMLEATRAHRELARQRLAGEMKLRIGTTVTGGTALEIVTDDMPFLVDSVTAALTARNLDVHLLVHPLVVVRREPLGALKEIRFDVEPDDAGPGDMVESWMRVEVDRIRDDVVVEQLRNDLARVLTDVREAVEDWPRMRQQALAWPTSCPAPSFRCRTRTSPTRSSCCAGSPTTTSRSSATASTSCSRTTRVNSRCRRCSAPGWASCGPTSRSRGR